MGFTLTYCSDNDNHYGPQDGTVPDFKGVKVRDVCVDCLEAYFQENKEWRYSKKNAPPKSKPKKKAKKKARKRNVKERA